MPAETRNKNARVADRRPGPGKGVSARIKRSHMHIQGYERTDGGEDKDTQEELVERFVKKKKRERLICVKREIYFSYLLEHNFNKRLIYT